jgi:hypothetical protein
MRRLMTSRLIPTIALAIALLSPTTTLSAQSSLDFDLPNGHFYTQANGAGGQGGTGYAIVDADESPGSFGVQTIPFYSAFKQHGGVQALGYPASTVTVFPDFPIQINQKLVLQYQPGKGVFFLNTFDILHDRGFDPFLDSTRSIPPPFDSTPDSSLPDFAAVTARHQGFLSADPAIRAVYFGVPDPVLQFGLPTGTKDYGNVFVVRAQRAAFQHWRVDVGPNKANTVTIVNGGDIGKEVNLFPLPSVVPVGPPNWNTNLLVLTPGTGQTVKSPISVSGYGRLFEAVGNWELKDASSHVIGNGNFMAVSGTSPTFARFDFTITYSVPTQQSGTLSIFDLSAKDGSRQDVLTIPVTLQP